MQRRVIAGVLAIVLAVVGAVIVFLYVRGADQRAVAQLDPTNVLVVTQPIAAGQPAQRGVNVDIRQLPKSAVAADALADAGSLSGKVAAIDLVPGEQVLPSRFVSPADFKGDVVPIPKELVQVTVTLPAEKVLGGLIVPGNTVGVILSVDKPDETTQAILHNVLVARVQKMQANQQQGNEPSANPNATGAFVTLATTAADAERIVWGAEFGRLWLTLERPESNTTGNPSPVNPTSVRR